ncbi:hypothetical protein ELE36_02640 [Pseudolysobacter antarcticus]|uniref:Uncharacterized protein n=1 Tax=Pseudolysobacter antarcticus TaxID=2511995 RepID=A0A411HFW2_9GAMM|nr:hypothetical protein [Pseudolysobacter antarcticus]QBB69359.1 hypothetical protein ELE36_02640 [Pseudolysobacter antarcticus]
MTICLHIGHPTERTFPGLEACITGYVNRGGFKALCGEWQDVRHPYDHQGSLDARDFCSNVLARPGPVLLLKPIKSDVLADIRTRLHGRTQVLVGEACDEPTLAQLLAELKRGQDAGEPLLPIDLVVGLLIVRKLERDHFWGGDAKGYMWRDNVPKGRGIGPHLVSRVPEVLNTLVLNEYLIKKTSNGKPKFAVNPDQKHMVYDCLRDRDFVARAGQLLRRNPGTVTAAELADLDDYKDPRV